MINDVTKKQIVYLVLDDEIGMEAMNPKATFDMGVHAERVCSALCDRSELVLPFNGRIVSANGTESRLETPVKCSQELLRRLRISVAGIEVKHLDIRILLDLKWWENETFGRELLDQIFRNWRGAIGRVVVYSLWTDNEAKKEFAKRFEIPSNHCLDKTGISIDRTIQLLTK